MPQIRPARLAFFVETYNLAELTHAIEFTQALRARVVKIH